MGKDEEDKSSEVNDKKKHVADENQVRYPSTIYILLPLAGLIFLVFKKNIFSRIMLQLDRQCLSVFCPSLSRREKMLRWATNRLPLSWSSHTKTLSGGVADLWSDGSLLCTLINTAVPGACPNPHRHWNKPPSHAQAIAYKYLGIVPLFTEDDFSGPLSINLERNFLIYLNELQDAINEIDDKIENINKFSSCFIPRGMGLFSGEQYRKAEFYVYLDIVNSIGNHNNTSVIIQIRGPYGTYGQASIPQFHNNLLKINVISDLLSLPKLARGANTKKFMEQFPFPSTKYHQRHTGDNIVIDVTIERNRAKVSYIPKNYGMYEINMIANGELLKGCPYHVHIFNNTSGIEESFESNLAVENRPKYKKRKVISRIIDFIDMNLPLSELKEKYGGSNDKVTTKKIILNTSKFSFKEVVEEITKTDLKDLIAKSAIISSNQLKSDKNYSNKKSDLDNIINDDIDKKISDFAPIMEVDERESIKHEESNSNHDSIPEKHNLESVSENNNSKDQINSFDISTYYENTEPNQFKYQYDDYANKGNTSFPPESLHTSNIIEKLTKEWKPKSFKEKDEILLDNTSYLTAQIEPAIQSIPDEEIVLIEPVIRSPLCKIQNIPLNYTRSIANNLEFEMKFGNSQFEDVKSTNNIEKWNFNANPSNNDHVDRNQNKLYDGKHFCKTSQIINSPNSNITTLYPVGTRTCADTTNSYYINDNLPDLNEKVYQDKLLVRDEKALNRNTITFNPAKGNYSNAISSDKALRKDTANNSNCMHKTISLDANKQEKQIYNTNIGNMLSKQEVIKSSRPTLNKNRAESILNTADKNENISKHMQLDRVKVKKLKIPETFLDTTTEKRIDIFKHKKERNNKITTNGVNKKSESCNTENKLEVKLNSAEQRDNKLFPSPELNKNNHVPALPPNTTPTSPICYDHIAQEVEFKQLSVAEKRKIFQQNARPAKHNSWSSSFLEDENVDFLHCHRDYEGEGPNHPHDLLNDSLSSAVSMPNISLETDYISSNLVKYKTQYWESLSSMSSLGSINTVPFPSAPTKTMSSLSRDKLIWKRPHDNAPTTIKNKDLYKENPEIRKSADDILSMNYIYPLKDSRNYQSMDTSLDQCSMISIEERKRLLLKQNYEKEKLAKPVNSYGRNLTAQHMYEISEEREITGTRNGDASYTSYVNHTAKDNCVSNKRQTEAKNEITRNYTPSDDLNEISKLEEISYKSHFKKAVNFFKGLEKRRIDISKSKIKTTEKSARRLSLDVGSKKKDRRKGGSLNLSNVSERFSVEHLYEDVFKGTTGSYRGTPNRKAVLEALAKFSQTKHRLYSSTDTNEDIEFDLFRKRGKVRKRKSIKSVFNVFY